MNKHHHLYQELGSRKKYLVVVDAYSKWPEVSEMTSATTGGTF